jgi:hypothetical protein
MAYTHRIVCLANSRKPGGSCVAGLEVTGPGLGKWIRPISARPTEEVSLEERRYQNGQDVQLLDVVDIDFLEHRPHSCQVENHVIDDNVHWRLVGKLPNNQLRAHATAVGPLWLDASSSGKGLNDRVHGADADKLDHSLKLVLPGALRIRVVTAYGKRQVRAAFDLGEHQYDLTVTDPTLETRYLAKADGEFPYPGEAVACISLGEPYKDGYRYKLVASIIDLP